MLYRNPCINANSVDPDQTPRFAASDLGLQCLPMSLKWQARHDINGLKFDMKRFTSMRIIRGITVMLNVCLLIGNGQTSSVSSDLIFIPIILFDNLPK